MSNSPLTARQRGVMAGVAVVMGLVFAVVLGRYAHRGLVSPIDGVLLFASPVVAVLAVYLAVTGRNFSGDNFYGRSQRLLVDAQRPAIGMRSPRRRHPRLPAPGRGTPETGGHG